jgi:hypothetical protein
MVPCRVHVHDAIAKVFAVHSNPAAASGAASTLAPAVSATPTTTSAAASFPSTSPITTSTSSAASTVRESAVDAVRWCRLQRGPMLSLWLPVHEPWPCLFSMRVRVDR